MSFSQVGRSRVRRDKSCLSARQARQVLPVKPKSWQIPSKWSWQSVSHSDAKRWERISGVSIAAGSYTSRVVDQHKSKWCGCCYLVATLQMLQDRMHIRIGVRNPKTNVFPAIQFNLQKALDAYTQLKKRGGWNACHGGCPLQVMQSIERGYLKLRVDVGGGEWYGFPNTVHTMVSNVKLRMSKSRRIQFSKVDYPGAIQREILMNGPVVLGVDARTMNDVHISSRGGNATKQCKGNLNHAVSVVGWVQNEGDIGSSWICRNSWGQYSVPVSKPEFITCVRLNVNECDIATHRWEGDPKNKGYVYIPFDATDVSDSSRSQWFTCDFDD